jgi:hypothetical protein
MELLPFVLTPSTTKYEYWKRHKRNPNLSIFNNKKGMLTATIEQKCSASIKHRACQSAAHTQQF